MQSTSPYYNLAHDFALFTNRSIFLTGKAGTGKTTFLHSLKAETKKQMAIVAPTGVAAINAGGTTIHSFFQLPFTPFVPTVQGKKDLVEKIKMTSFRRKVLQELELLVIDEISMVRADVLDAVDTILKHFRYRNNEPFGGVQVIFIGDMFQLSPVAIENEWRLLSGFYKSPYFFHSQVISQQPPVHIEFDKIFRQTNADFISLLNEIRNNRLSEEGLKLLQSRYNPTFIPAKEDTYITLTTHNYKADKTNSDELSKLNGKIYRFQAGIKGDFPEKSYPTEKELVLKIGAKVMFIKNDNQTVRRFFNGKIGIIEDIEENTIFIKCPEDNEIIELERMVWENVRYSTNDKTKQIEEETIGTFEQYPLRLAWAITIHKSQGLTFEKAIIDAEDAFSPGQVYVALSRCRSLEGMVLWSKINPNSIENDRQIVEHEQRKLPALELEKILNEARNEFRMIVLNQLFDFKVAIGFISRLIRDIKEVESSFNEETQEYLQSIFKQIENIQNIAVKFQHQIQNILVNQPVNEDYLSERLTAAMDFFKVKVEQLMETLRQSPAVTDSREKGKNYDEQIGLIFGFLAQKLHIFKELKQPFIVEDYFLLKNTFLLPAFSVNSYAKTTSAKAIETRNQKLYYKLMALRNKICEPDDLPIYIVAGSKTLLEMSNYLPLNEDDLLRISGFGPAKVLKYGSLFLDVIQQYCNENNLTSLMNEKEKPKEKKAKRQVGETYKTSLEMYKQGKAIDEIAFSRNLAKTTIISHLERYIISGELNIDEFVSSENREKAAKMIREKSEIDSTYEILSSFMTYTEVKMYMAWLRGEKNKN